MNRMWKVESAGERLSRPRLLPLRTICNEMTSFFRNLTSACRYPRAESFKILSLWEILRRRT